MIFICRLFELFGQESNAKLLARESAPLQGIGPQNCLAFSVDGSKLATGGLVSNNFSCCRFLLFDFVLRFLFETFI